MSDEAAWRNAVIEDFNMIICKQKLDRSFLIGAYILALTAFILAVLK